MQYQCYYLMCNSMSGILTVYHGKVLCNCNLRGRINVANVSTSTAVPSVISVRTCFVVFSQYLYGSASFLVLRSNYEAEKVGNALSKSSLNKSGEKLKIDQACWNTWRARIFGRETSRDGCTFWREKSIAYNPWDTAEYATAFLLFDWLCFFYTIRCNTA